MQGSWSAASIAAKHRDLWGTASELIREIDPNYHWTSIAFNRNFRGSLHRDDKDASHQVALAFGEYEGGELRVHGQDGIIDVNTRDRSVRVDGRYAHEVLPYLLLTACYSLLTTHSLLLTPYASPLTTHYLLLTTYYSLTAVVLMRFCHTRGCATR